MLIDGGLSGSTGGVIPPLASLANKGDGNEDGAPKAYLNYLLFDRDYNFITAGFEAVTEAAREYGQDGAHEKLFKELTIKEAGYVYLYLSNDNVELNGNVIEVFFDDFTVEHVKSPVVQQDDYYPFGLAFNLYSRENNTKNNYLYNGKELQDELDLGWLDYGARIYDPTIAKWNGVDKLTDAYASFSPYNYVLGNPIANTDVNGQWTVTRHHRMTLEALSLAGIGGKQAGLIAHYTSIYADNPGEHLVWNNRAHPTYQLSYRNDVNYLPTTYSQVTDYSGAGWNWNIWHSMRSPWEKEQYDKGLPGGISASDAMSRGMAFGWEKVFDSAFKGKLSSFKVNDEGLQDFGQGVHALQDAYAHEGRHDVGAGHLWNDRYGDTSQAQMITNSAIMVHSIMSGDTENFNKMLEQGNSSMDLKGISGNQLLDLNDRVKQNGKQLVYNWDTGKYDVK